MYRDHVAGRCSCHVAVGQSVVELRIWCRELSGQLVGEPTFFGFEEGTRAMGYQDAQRRVGMLNVAEVAGTVD
jgi:hypothetical protein